MPDQPAPTTPDRQLATHASQIEAKSHLDLVLGAEAALRDELGVTESRHGEIIVACCRHVDHMWFSRGFGLDQQTSLTRQDVHSVIQAFRDRGVSRFSVQIDSDTDDTVRGWLEECGLERYYRKFDLLVRERSVRPPEVGSGFRIEPVSADHKSEYARILRNGLDFPESAEQLLGAAVGRPGWETYLAFDGDRPAAAAALYVSGELGYMAGGATVPEFRSRGAQSALLATRIRRATELGCRFIASETGQAVPGKPNHSHRNMCRLGFRVVGTRDNYAPKGVGWS